MTSLQGLLWESGKADGWTDDTNSAKEKPLYTLPAPMTHRSPCDCVERTTTAQSMQSGNNKLRCLLSTCAYRRALASSKGSVRLYYKWGHVTTFSLRNCLESKMITFNFRAKLINYKTIRKMIFKWQIYWEMRLYTSPRRGWWSARGCTNELKSFHVLYRRILCKTVCKWEDALHYNIVEPFCPPFFADHELLINVYLFYK